MQLVFFTERLKLAPLELTDLDLAIELFADQEVVQYVFDISTPEEIEAELPNNIKRCAGGCIGVWCITDRFTGEKFGTVALLPMPLDEDDTNWQLVQGEELPDTDIEIGYFLKRNFWGRGIATEACQRLVQFAFAETDLTELKGCIDEGNIASRNVLVKNGFEYLGYERAYGKQYPMFQITKEIWNKA